MSMQTEIFNALKTKLEELTWVQKVDFEIIRLMGPDIREHETPLIQYYDAREESRHLQGRTEVSWTIIVEVIMKNKETDTVTQTTLLDRKFDVKEKIGDNVRLDLGSLASTVGRFKHMAYRGARTDLHIMEPYFLAVLEFEALYEEPYTASC